MVAPNNQEDRQEYIEEMEYERSLDMNLLQVNQRVHEEYQRLNQEISKLKAQKGLLAEANQKLGTLLNTSRGSGIKREYHSDEPTLYYQFCTTNSQGFMVEHNLTEDQLEQKHIELLAGHYLKNFWDLPTKAQEIITNTIYDNTRGRINKLDKDKRETD